MDAVTALCSISPRPLRTRELFQPPSRSSRQVSSARWSPRQLPSRPTSGDPAPHPRGGVVIGFHLASREAVDVVPRGGQGPPRPSLRSSLSIVRARGYLSIRSAGANSSNVECNNPDGLDASGGHLAKVKSCRHGEPSRVSGSHRGLCGHLPTGPAALADYQGISWSARRSGRSRLQQAGWGFASLSAHQPATAHAARGPGDGVRSRSPRPSSRFLSYVDEGGNCGPRPHGHQPSVDVWTSPAMSTASWHFSALHRELHAEGEDTGRARDGCR